MKTQYLIFSDAGHIESGNDLPEERWIIAAPNKPAALETYYEAQDFCENHISEQIAIVKRNPNLIQDVSTFYWWVILLQLPNQIPYRKETRPEVVAKLFPEPEDPEKRIKDFRERIISFASHGFDRELAEQNLESWIFGY